MCIYVFCMQYTEFSRFLSSLQDNLQRGGIYRIGQSNFSARKKNSDQTGFQLMRCSHARIFKYCDKKGVSFYHLSVD